MELKQLYDLVAQHWKFDPTTYPSLASIPAGEESTRFAQHHLLLHFLKDLGKFATALERRDHGATDNADSELDLRVFLRNCLINTLRLAELVGCPTSVLENLVVTWADSRR